MKRTCRHPIDDEFLIVQVGSNTCISHRMQFVRNFHINKFSSVEQVSLEFDNSSSRVDADGEEDIGHSVQQTRTRQKHEVEDDTGAEEWC